MDEQAPEDNTFTNSLNVLDFLSYHNVSIPDNNQLSSVVYNQAIHKRIPMDNPMNDCPSPRFWSLTPIKVGYLTKQGDQFRTWKRRLCAIEGHYLYYYNEESDQLPKGVLLLDNCIVEEDPMLTKERKMPCFSLKVVRSWNLSSLKAVVNRTYYFCVANGTSTDVNDWISLLQLTSTGMSRYATDDLW